MLGPTEIRRGIRVWSEGYDGLLYDDREGRARSLVYGWDTRDRTTETRVCVPAQGALWGFVAQGSAHVRSASGHTKALANGEFFVTANGAEILLAAGALLFAVQQIGFLAIPMLGGPIEARGRLRYIDGCSDSLIIPPLVVGDPCLNHLHFPVGIAQTHHTHPSIRAGVVARGAGACTTSSGVLRLHAGLIFVIPAHDMHGFHTASEAMDVVAYHPDSDHGPQHDDHPMINRTIVEGQKIDNSTGTHRRAEIVEGRFRVESVDSHASHTSPRTHDSVVCET